MDARESSQMGLLTVGYYTVTTVLSTIVRLYRNKILHDTPVIQTGIILVTAIHPGDPTIKADIRYNKEHTPVSPLDTFLDVVR